MSVAYSEIGPLQVLNATGEIYTRSVGARALLASAAQGTRVQVITDGLGQHQIELVPQSITPAYLSFESGRQMGAALTASDVDPGGVYKIQNTSGKELYLKDLQILLTALSAGACTLDVGVSLDPLAVGGSNNIFDGIDVNAGPLEFDSRMSGDHPAAGRVGATWPNLYWLSITVITGASAGLAGRVLFMVTDNLSSKAIF